MRIPRGVTRHIRFYNAYDGRQKVCSPKIFAARLRELADTLEEESYQGEHFRSIRCLWRGGIYLEIHATNRSKQTP